MDNWLLSLSLLPICMIKSVDKLNAWTATDFLFLLCNCHHAFFLSHASSSRLSILDDNSMNGFFFIPSVLFFFLYWKDTALLQAERRDYYRIEMTRSISMWLFIVFIHLFPTGNEIITIFSKFDFDFSLWRSNRWTLSTFNVRL
jgi:hypothetical protein